MHTKRDANHADIVAVLRSAHIDVIDLADVPANVRYLADLPDIIAGGMHQKWQMPVNWLIEIKPEGVELRPSQREFHRWWRGLIADVRTGDEALALFGIGD